MLGHAAYLGFSTTYESLSPVSPPPSFRNPPPPPLAPPRRPDEPFADQATEILDQLWPVILVVGAMMALQWGVTLHFGPAKAASHVLPGYLALAAAGAAYHLFQEGNVAKVKLHFFLLLLSFVVVDVVDVCCPRCQSLQQGAEGFMSCCKECHGGTKTVFLFLAALGVNRAQLNSNEV